MRSKEPKSTIPLEFEEAYETLKTRNNQTKKVCIEKIRGNIENVPESHSARKSKKRTNVIRNARPTNDQKNWKSCNADYTEVKRLERRAKKKLQERLLNVTKMAH